MSNYTPHEQEAYDLGRDHAVRAASWVIDGNTSASWIGDTLSRLEAGDPEGYDRLPRAPNLSGEFADDPTPLSLARDILGVEDRDDIEPEFLNDLADAYEAGVSDWFDIECERILRAALDNA
jgi:hypothetical protein